MTTLSVFAAHLDAGTWSVLKILSANDDAFVVFGAWQHWRVERPPKFRARMTTVSVFSARLDAGA